MAKSKDQMVKEIREMQKERIVIYPVGVDSKDRSSAYVVKGDAIWYLRDKKATTIRLG